MVKHVDIVNIKVKNSDSHQIREGNKIRFRGQHSSTSQLNHRQAGRSSEAQKPLKGKDRSNGGRARAGLAQEQTA